MIPHEIRLIAQAVLDGDETAALALLDALTEIRGQLHPQILHTAWRELRDGKPGQSLHTTPNRVLRMLRRLDIQSVAQLASKSPEELLDVQNFGPTTLQWVRRWLAQHGLHLRGDDGGRLALLGYDGVLPATTEAEGQ